MKRLTRSTALRPAFEGGEGKRRSGSTRSKPRHLCRGVKALTLLILLLVIPWLIPGCGKGKGTSAHREGMRHEAKEAERPKKIEEMEMKSLTMESIQKQGKMVKIGGQIVTSANFLVDSESNLKEALAWVAGTPGMEHGPRRK